MNKISLARPSSQTDPRPKSNPVALLWIKLQRTAQAPISYTFNPELETASPVTSSSRLERVHDKILAQLTSQMCTTRALLSTRYASLTRGPAQKNDPTRIFFGWIPVINSSYKEMQKNDPTIFYTMCSTHALPYLVLRFSPKRMTQPVSSAHPLL